MRPFFLAGKNQKKGDENSMRRRLAFLLVLVLLATTLAGCATNETAAVHTPPQEYSMTAEGGALVPREWCIHSGEMVHGGRRRGAPSRHAGAYSGRALRLRMDSPSIWIVYAL